MTHPLETANAGRGEFTTLVRAARGMTDEEAVRFLTTGEVPDLSPPAVTGLTEDEARTLLNRPLVAAGGPGAPSEVTLAFDPGQLRDRNGRWTKIGGDRDLSRLPGYRRSRLETLEQLDSVSYPLSQLERREMADLQAQARGVTRTSPREMSPQEKLDAAPLGLRRKRDGGTELVCRGGDSSCPDEDTLNKISLAAITYRGPGYQEINEKLRSREVTYPPKTEIDRQIDLIETGMAASLLAEDVVVFRGLSDIDGLFPDDADDLTGWTWNETSYVSTTVNPEVAEHFGETMIMNITVPKGTGAMQLSESRDDQKSGEGELLIARNKRMRVIADHGVNRRGQRIIDVEVF